MPFSYVLANLLAQVEHAVGVLFIDDSGETVDLACSHGSPFEVKVVGAYLGIHLRQLQEIAAEQGLGKARMLQIERHRMNVYARAIEDGYFLALLQQRPCVTGQTHEALRRAEQSLRRELFPRPPSAGQVGG